MTDVNDPWATDVPDVPTDTPPDEIPEAPTEDPAPEPEPESPAAPATEAVPGEVLITRDNPRPGPGVPTVMYDDELPAAGPGQGHVLPNGLLAGSETVVEGGLQAPDRLIPRPSDVPHPDAPVASPEPPDAVSE